VAVRFNKFITSVGYLTVRENKVELLTTKFYNYDYKLIIQRSVR